MALNPPNAGLRAIKHNAISASKVTLSVPAGDVLVVSDEVAEQLVAAAGEFQEIRDAVKINHVEKAPAKKSGAKSKG